MFITVSGASGYSFSSLIGSCLVEKGFDHYHLSVEKLCQGGLLSYFPDQGNPDYSIVDSHVGKIKPQDIGGLYFDYSFFHWMDQRPHGLSAGFQYSSIIAALFGFFSCLSCKVVNVPSSRDVHACEPLVTERFRTEAGVLKASAFYTRRFEDACEFVDRFSHNVVVKGATGEFYDFKQSTSEVKKIFDQGEIVKLCEKPSGRMIQLFYINGQCVNADRYDSYAMERQIQVIGRILKEDTVEVAGVTLVKNVQDSTLYLIDIERNISQSLYIDQFRKDVIEAIVTTLSGEC